MATPSRQLIDLLLRTADDIETNPNYNWYRTEDCNCGILAKNAGCPVVIDGQLVEAGDDWEYIITKTCSQTGLPLVEAVKTLLSLGLTVDDIVHLEDCNDRNILESMPKDVRGEHTIPTYVAAYLRAWASLLDKQLLAQALIGLQPALTLEKVMVFV